VTGMKTSRRVFLSVSALLMIASFATCHFGRRHAINQIPPETFSQMEDTDWIGVEWIDRGMYLFIVAVLIGLIPVFRLIITRLRHAR